MNGRSRLVVGAVSLAAVLAPAATTALRSPAPARTRPIPAAHAAPATAPAPPLPERRFAPCGALDPDGEQIHVFGGRSEAAITHFADAWQLDLDDAGGRASWRRSATADAEGAPPPTRSCAAAWDRDDGRLVVFGGWNGVTMRNGVWALEDGTWSQLCDTTSCGTPPSPRRAAAAAYDSERDELVVVGGLDGSFRNDIWTLSLDGAPQWTERVAAGPRPTPRASHTLTYDDGRDRMWMVGGTTSGSDLGDVWSLDLATMTWAPVATAGCPTDCPSPRSGHVVGLDAQLDQLVLYGGLQSSNGHAPPEVWALAGLDGSAPDWRRLVVDGAVPQPRFVPIGAFTGRRLVVFGGGLVGSAYRDTIALHVPLVGQPFWRSIAPRTPFTARDQSASTIAADGTITTFGGFGSGTFPGAIDAGLHLADTWQLPLHTGGRRQWVDVTSANPRQVPLAREAVALAHDRVRDRVFLVGGLNGDVSLDDVWVLRTRRGAVSWRQLCSSTSCGEAPAPRWGAHAVWDADDARVLLFGGRRSDGSSLDDTWALELVPEPRWVKIETGDDRPAPRWGGAVVYDAIHDRMVVFGGQSGPDFAASPHDDTWSLSLDGDPQWTQLEPTGPGPSARRSPAYATAPPSRRGRAAGHQWAARAVRSAPQRCLAAVAAFGGRRLATAGARHLRAGRRPDVPALGECGVGSPSSAAGAAVRPRRHALRGRRLVVRRDRPSLERCRGRSFRLKYRAGHASRPSAATGDHGAQPETSLDGHVAPVADDRRTVHAG